MKATKNRDNFWEKLHKELSWALESNTDLRTYACEDAADAAINAVRGDPLEILINEETDKCGLFTLLTSIQRHHFNSLDDFEKRELEYFLKLSSE